jgi:hypothetical protein
MSSLSSFVRDDIFAGKGASRLNGTSGENVAETAAVSATVSTAAGCGPGSVMPYSILVAGESKVLVW